MTVSFLTWSSAAAAGRPRCSPRWRRLVPEALADLLSGATERAGLDQAPGKSGAALERVVIDGQPYVLKHLDLAEDWTMRASGCLRGAPLVLWERGILARLPGCLNQPIVAAAPARRGCTLLMRDVGRWLVPATDAPIPLDQHTRFLRHMATLHAAFWQCGDEFDVVPAMHRYLGPLLEALAATPQTFVHSNFKLDNLGTDDEGRTVLLDWEQPGRGAPLSDLAWYLAINCRRLPQSKQASIAAYREALEGCGIDTGPWWDRQLALCLLGAMVLFGWEKALGGYDEELAWWETESVRAAAL